MGPVPTVLRVVTPEDRAELDRHLREHRMTYGQIVAWLRTRGYTSCLQSVRRYAIAHGLRKLRRRRTRIDEILSTEERIAYEALLTNPATRPRDARAWLAARGHVVGSMSVGIHRRRFLEKIDAVRDVAQFSAAVTQVAREHGEAALSDGMLTGFEQLMVEQLSQARERAPMLPRELADLSKSVASAVGSRERFEAMRREFEEAKCKAAEAAETAAKGGATGREVVERVREILGV